MSNIGIKKYIEELNSFNENIETKKCAVLIDNDIIKIDKRVNEIDEKYLIKPHFRKYTKNPYKVSDKAYATLLMVDESYLPSVLVLGYSLRKYKNNYNLICLVQDKPTKKKIDNEVKTFSGVSKKAIDDILEIFDVVYGVDLLQLEQPSKTGQHFTERIQHYKNISIYVTKSQVLGLLDYKRILYMDASTVAYANLDFMFKEYDKNSFLWDSSVNKTDMGIHGAVFLIEPNIRIYNKSLYLIYNYEKVFCDLYFKRGIDETILYFSVYPHWSKKLIKPWTRCTENYKFKKCPIYHYQICKPFKKMPNNIENKNKYTFSIWDKFAKEFIAKYPEMKKYFTHINEFRCAYLY